MCMNRMFMCFHFAKSLHPACGQMKNGGRQRERERERKRGECNRHVYTHIIKNACTDKSMHHTVLLCVCCFSAGVFSS